MVEGDSAGGTAKQGRNRKYQAVLPLRGKVLNVEKARFDKMLSSDSLGTLIKAMGTSIGEEFDISKLRYHKIILMTDPDVDGSHIRTLLLTFFFRHMPQIIQEGHLYIAQPPLYGIRKRGKMIYIKDDPALASYLVQNALEDSRLVLPSGETLTGKDLEDFVLKACQFKNLLEKIVRFQGSRKILERLAVSRGGHPDLFEQAFQDYSQWVLDGLNTQNWTLTEGLKNSQQALRQPKEADEEDQTEPGGDLFLDVQTGEDVEEDLLEQTQDTETATPLPARTPILEKTSLHHNDGDVWGGHIFSRDGKKVLKLYSLLKGDMEEQEISLDLFHTKEMKSLLKLGAFFTDIVPLNGQPAGTMVWGNQKKDTINFPTQLWSRIDEEGRKGITIQRFKGLGEMEASQLAETTLDPDSRNLLQVKVADQIEAENIFSILMGDVVEPRRDFIQKNALDVVHLDI